MEGSNWYVERDNPTRIAIDKNDFTFTIQGHKVAFDCVFVAIHGTPAEDGKLQGYFDLLKIPYNCCGVLQAALTFDKVRCKEYLQQFGVLTAKGVLIKKKLFNAANLNPETFSYPVFVKPNKNGSSYGASKVNTPNDLLPAIENGFKYDDEILVEDYLKGTEVTCGVITVDGKVTALPVTELRSKNEFFDYEAKYQGLSQEITPAEIESALAEKIQRTSEFIYSKLDFKGMCRIDYIIMNSDYYMLEVNSIPGLSEASILPQQAACVGINLEKLFEISVEEALKATVTSGS
jgi:D-alanine-D-alanine ligase